MQQKDQIWVSRGGGGKWLVRAQRIGSTAEPLTLSIHDRKVKAVRAAKKLEQGGQHRGRLRNHTGD